MEKAVSIPNIDVSAVKWLFEPASVDSFLRAWGTKSFLHLSGEFGKFNHLITWSELSRVLEQHRMMPPRLILIKKGRQIDQQLYLEPEGPFRTEYRVRSQFITELRAGATLILNHIDDFSTATQELAQELEWALRTGVHANLYAGWGSDNGFDLHRDEHDTLILQVAGKKRWAIHRPNERHPFKTENDTLLRPTGPPLWNGNLEDGSLLYIPRGWWHVAVPQDEPTLHLTMTIRNPSGIDFLQWLANLMTSKSVCPMDLPHLNGESEAERFSREMLGELTREWSPSLMSTFLAHRDVKVKPRPHVNLSIIPFLKNSDLPTSGSVRLTVPRQLRLANDPSSAVQFEANGRTWTFPCSMVAALALLNDYRWHSVSELRASIADSAKLKQMLIDLVLGGVVKVDCEDPNGTRLTKSESR
jgi:ribosomal protein L16 Arg81 hydroxylase